MSAAVPLASIPVGVLVERRKAASPWIDYTWRPSNVLPGAAAAAPWTVIAEGAAGATYYAGAAEIALYRTETPNYRDNLATGAPQLWVVLRPTGLDPAYELIAVTADPAEGEAFTEAGGDLVEPVPMPEPIQEAVAAFVAEHHVERPFFKRKRDPAHPEALGRRPRIYEDE